MADLRISELRQISEGEVQANDEYAIADRSNNETRKITALDQAKSGVRLLPDESIPVAKVDLNGIVLPEDTVNTDQIVDGAVTTEKLADDSVTADKIASDAVELEHLKADSFVRGINKATDGIGHSNLEITASQRLGLTYDKFGHIIDSDGDVDFGRGIDDDGTTVGHTNSVTPASRLGVTYDAHGHATVIAEDHPFGRGIDENDTDIGHTNSVAAGSRLGITFDEHGHVTAAEADKTFGRGIDEGPTDIGHTNSITAGSRLGITFDEFGHVESAEPDKPFGRGIDENDDDIGHTNEIVAGSQSGISYDEHGHITAVTGLIPSDDLPIATTTELGAVYVPDDGGLTVSGAGALSHSHSITANTTGAAKVTYDNYGHVTGEGTLDSTDLPLATETTPGAVIVPSSGQLAVDGAGNITHAQVGASGTYTKVTVDEYGHVTTGGSLESSDLPPISIDDVQGEITIDGNVTLGECAVNGPNICDYATCLMQEDHPGPGEFLGQFWYTPSTAQLRVYARGSGPENIWLPVGFGLLQQQNLRFAFTFDATTSTVVSITQYGAPLGLKPGDPIPVATDTLAGAYGVCVEPGNSIALFDVENASFTQGDWIVCAGEATGWVHVDVGQGGGGGGGVQILNDLLDVTIGGNNPVDINLTPDARVPLEDGHVLRYYSAINQWINAPDRNGAYIDSTPPANPRPGALWWDDESGRLFISYDDGNTVQWVPATPESGAGGGSGDSTIELLNDLVDVEAAKTGEAFLQYNDNTNRWESTTTIDGGSF